jgi:V-type H+-transporting ATPase 21kDa proteolipid subunit
VADPILFAGLGVGLSISLAAIGAGLGIGITGPGVAGATTEKPEVFARSFIAVVLAEALAIYGLVVALLAVFKLPTIVTNAADPATAATALNSAFRIFAAGIAMGGGALGAGFGIGTTGSAMASATAEKSELYSRVVIPVILSEALAIYSLIIALLLVLQA